MCHPRNELAKYGPRRIRRIAEFLVYGGRGFSKIFLEKRWVISESNVLEGVCSSGAFEYICERYNRSWEILIASLMLDEDCLHGFCKLFGMMEVGEDSLRKVVNKLSVVYIFPGDPAHPLSRKKINDIRIGALTRRNLSGRDPANIAREITSFDQAVTDPLLRNIFWNCYTPGSGNFAISVSNLEQLDDVDDLCPVCLEEFTNVFPGIRLQPCHHIFHPRCVQALILNLGDLEMTCPVCRSHVSSLC